MGNKKQTDEERLAVLSSLGIPPAKKRQILNGVSIDAIIKQGYAYIEWMNDDDRTTMAPGDAIIPSEVERHIKLKIHDLLNNLENELIDAMVFPDAFNEMTIDAGTALEAVRRAQKKVATL